MLREDARLKLVRNDMGHANVEVAREGGRHQMRGSIAQGSIVAIHG
jgi:hypothetical protein